MDRRPRDLQPLGMLASGRLDIEELRRSQDQLDVPTRRLVSQYLRSGTIIIPLMSYTADVLGDKFGVSGGSAIVSDGVFYWRGDAPDYVLHYGIGLDDAAVDHMRRQGWAAGPLPPDAVDELDHYFANR